MMSLKRILLLSLTLLLFVPASAQREDQKQLELADGYYKRGEFRKALLTYQKLYEAQPYSYTYIYKMVDTYRQLEQYDKALKILEQKIIKNRNPLMLVEIGYNYQLTDASIKQKNYMKKL